jgi:hypothetical protein
MKRILSVIYRYRLTSKSQAVILMLRLLESQMVKEKIKNLVPRTADTKYTGQEPEWPQAIVEDQRQIHLLRAFQWYNYHCDKKTAKQCVLDWLWINHKDHHRAFARIPDSAVPYQLAWLCRMNIKGWVFDEHEEKYVQTTISDHLHAWHEVNQVVTPTVDVLPVPNIQDRLRCKAHDVAGELEGLYDDLIAAGAKMSADFKPLSILRGMNLPAQMVPVIRDIWQQRLGELTELIAGKDTDLAEGYSHFSKVQLRGLIKFCEQVLADCGSYQQIKQIERKPKKKKAVSPEHLSRKFKFQNQHSELALVSLPPARLISASEAWLYDTKKRKLVHVVADAHIGSLTIKNNTLVGFDETNTVQKTLRKPAEQLKALLTASVPNSRRLFKDIRATEVRYNGRGNENLVILKVK